MKKLLALILLVSTPSYADDVFAAYGLGVFNNAKNTPSEVKAGNVGYRADIIGGTYWQFKVGYWGDGSGDPSRKSSFYVSTGPGLIIDLRPVELRSGWGVGGITNPDGYLGGYAPQFNGELYVGLRDRHGNAIGLKYEHISSAGIVTPNAGRDFLLLEISQGW